jgi:hypothetical protein
MHAPGAQTVGAPAARRSSRAAAAAASPLLLLLSRRLPNVAPMRPSRRQQPPDALPFPPTARCAPFEAAPALPCANKVDLAAATPRIGAPLRPGRAGTPPPALQNGLKLPGRAPPGSGRGWAWQPHCNAGCGSNALRWGAQARQIAVPRGLEAQAMCHARLVATLIPCCAPSAPATRSLGGHPRSLHLHHLRARSSGTAHVATSAMHERSGATAASTERHPGERIPVAAADAHHCGVCGLRKRSAAAMASTADAF